MPYASSNKQNKNAVNCAFVILAAAVFAVLTVAALYARIQLARENGESVLLSEQLEELCEENKRLTVAIGSALPLAENEGLGASYKSNTQSIEISVEKRDRAEIIGKEDNKDTRFYSWISSISDIFRKGK